MQGSAVACRRRGQSGGDTHAVPCCVCTGGRRPDPATEWA